MAIDKVTFTGTSVQVILDGKVYTAQKGSLNYEALRRALYDEDEKEVRDLLNPVVKIEQWAKGRFTVHGKNLHFDGEPLPAGLNGKIMEMTMIGEDPQPLFNFWERLSRNPSSRSVEQLWPFLDNFGIPITKGGYLLAYKSVNRDLKDKHTGKIDNSPGAFLSMPRNKVSDDPNTACHYGYHAGSLEYARDIFGSSGSPIVIVLIDPADVVCIPNDHSWQKMRFCRYKVVGMYGDRLEAGVFDEADLPEVEFGNEITEEALEAERLRITREGEALMAMYGVQEERDVVDAADYSGFEDLDEVDLLDQNLDSLRKYATHRLKIVGASKIRGGKRALVSAIVRARG